MTPESQLVSVILPAYNAAGTIRQAVDSVLQQTNVDFELIVVDDGSTDRTLDLLSAYEDQRLTILTGPNAGQSAARNRAIDLARGRFLAFLDADDVWLPNKLARQVAALSREPKAALVYAWTDYIDADGRRLCPDRRPTLAGDVYEEILTRNFIDTSSIVMVRKSAFDEVGRFDETLRVVEDWDLYIRLAARHSFVYIPEVLALYRRLSGSLTSQVLKMEVDGRRVFDRAFASAPAELQHLRNRTDASFYEYLANRTSQGAASRENGLLVLRLFGTSVRSWPPILISLWRRPWIFKALGKALFWSVARSATKEVRRPT